MTTKPTRDELAVLIADALEADLDEFSAALGSSCDRSSGIDATHIQGTFDLTAVAEQLLDRFWGEDRYPPCDIPGCGEPAPVTVKTIQRLCSAHGDELYPSQEPVSSDPAQPTEAS